MVAVVSGSGLGLFNTSRSVIGAGDSQDDPKVGRGRDGVFVNTTTGNLVVQSLDENLVGLGVDLAIVRTYNSQGHLDDDNGDNWRLGVHERLFGWAGTLNTVGSTVRKVYGDGAEIEFGYDAARARYVTTDGADQHDSLSYDAATSQWTWSDETGNLKENYDVTGRLLNTRDNIGNLITYIYSGQRLVQVTDGSGQQTYLDYDVAGNLTQIRVVSSGQTQILTRYSYDGSNRLQTVTVDLSPQDQSVADNNTYTTTYTYESSSRRIHSISQKDGSSVSFTYQLIDGEYRVHTFTDAENRTTTVDYSEGAAGAQSVSLPADSAQLSTTAPQLALTNYPLIPGALTTPPAAGWAGAAVRETSTTATDDPKIAFDAAGNGMLIRRTGNNIQAQRYTRATNSWSAEVTLDTRTNTTYAPSLSVDFATGNTVAAWVQSDGTANSVYAARFDVATGTWSAPTLIDVAPAGSTFAANNTTGTLVTAMSGARAAVAWLHNQATSGSNYNLYVARFDGTAWVAPALVESQSATAAQASLAIDGDGNIAVAFQQSDGTAASIYVNRFNATTASWSGAALRETSSTATNDPRIELDASGNGILIWRTGNNVQAQRYTRATNTWSADVTLDNRTTTTSAPALAVDPSGNAVAAWVQSDGTANSVYAARFNISTGTWSTPVLIDVAPAGSTFPANTATNSLVVTMRGTNAAIAWQHSQATSGSVYDMYVARFDGTTWQAPALVENQTANAAQPSIGIDAMGNVSVAFQQTDGGVNSVFVNRYSPGGTPYFTVRSGDTWQSIAALVYGIDSPAAGQALSAQMPGQSLALNSVLTNFPANIGLPTNYPLNTGAMTTPPLGIGTAQPVNLWNSHWIKSDALGNTFLLRIGSDDRFYLQRYDARTDRWSADVRIDGYTGSQIFSLQSPNLSVDADGNALVTWVQRDLTVTTTFTVFARTYSVATNTWSTPTALRSFANATIGGAVGYIMGDKAVVAFNSNGSYSGSAPTDIFVARWQGGAWQSAELVTSLSLAGNLGNVGLDGDGDIQVITRSNAATTYTVRDGATGQWSLAELVDDSNSQINFDFQGNAIALVDQSFSSTPISLRRYDATTNTWGERVTFPITGNTSPFLANALSSDAAGNAVVAWYERNVNGSSPGAIKYSRYDIATNAWSAVQTVASVPATASVPWVKAAISGNTVYVGWLDGTADRRFIGTMGALTDISVVGSSASTMATLDRAGNALLVSRDANFAANARRYYTSAAPYYTIPAGATWQTISQALYGSTVVADELQAAMGNPPLTAGTRLAMFPPALNDITMVAAAPHVIVRAGESWANIAERVYGTHDANAVAALRTYAGNVPLIVGAHVNVPANLQYLPVGTPTGSIYRSVNVVDSLGRTTTYSTDSRGRLVSVMRPAVDGFALQTTYSYDADGNVISITEDAAGIPRTTSFQYDSRGNLRISRDSLGDTVVRTYTQNNQISTETRYTTADPDGTGPALPGTPQTTRYIYDTANRLGYTISAEGRVTQYDYYTGNESKVAKITEITGRRYTDTDYRYGILGGWAGFSVLNPLNEVTRFYYDFRGNLTKTSRAAILDTVSELVAPRSDTTYTYDQRGRLIETVEARGVATTGNGVDYRNTYQYDGLGRLLATVEWLAPPAVGSSVETTRTTINQYDDLNRRTSTTLANGLVTTSVYNRAGELISVLNGTAPNGSTLGTTTYVYDGAGQLRISTDPSGVRQFFFYDAAGRNAARVDADGTVTESVYDARDKLVESITYAVRLSGTRLASLVDGAGNPTAVSLAVVRDEADGLPSEDRVTRQVFDSAGRLVFQIEQIDSVTRYNGSGQVIGYDPVGAVTRFIYDGAGQVVETVRFQNTVAIPRTYTLSPELLSDSGSAYYVAPHGDDRHSRNFYDNDGLLIASLDGDGYLSEAEYDGGDRVIRRTTFANQADVSVRASGSLAAIKASIGVDNEIVLDTERDASEYYFYDGQGRRNGVLDAEGYFTETVYDLAGHPLQVVRYSAQIAYGAAADTFAEARALAFGSPSHATTYEYDGAGRLKRETNYESTATTYEYDLVDNQLSVTSAAGTGEARTLAARYDLLGRTIQELSGEGSEALIGVTNPTTIEEIWSQYGVRYAYDAAGRRVSATVKPNGVEAKTYFYYDKDGRLQFELDALGRVKENVYDAFGQLTRRIDYYRAVTISNPQGGFADDTLAGNLRAGAVATLDAVANFQYNARGQVRATSTAESATTTAEYNTFGEVRSQTEGNGFAATTLTYDHRGFVDLKQRAGVTLEDRKYDAFGRLCTLVDALGNTSSVEYDRLGRTIATVEPGSMRRTTGYDPFSRVTSTADALQNLTSYSYDDANRRLTVETAEHVITITDHYRSGQTFRVTAAGNVSEFEYDDDGRLTYVSDSLGFVEEHGYDTSGRETSVKNARGIVTTFGYDAVDRRVTQTVDPGGLNLITTYTYDPNARHLDVLEPGSRLTRTEFDRDGRVVAVTRDPNGADASRTEYAYDGANHQTLVTEAANTLKPRRTQYLYDDRGRRREQIVDPTEFGGGAALNLRTLFKYDDNDNLTRRIEGAQLPVAEQRSTWYVYDAHNRVFQTIDALGGVTELTYDAEDRVVATRRYATSVNAGALGDVAGAVNPGATTNDRVSRSLFDRDGRERYSLDALGGVTERTFDDAGRVVQSRMYHVPLSDPAAATLGNIAGLLTAAGNSAAPHADDHMTWVAYDARGHAKYTVDGLGGVTKNVYDAGGNIIATIRYAVQRDVGAPMTRAALDDWADDNGIFDNGSNRTTRFWYDSLGRQRFTFDAEGYLTQTIYDDVAHEETTLAYERPPDSDPNQPFDSTATLVILGGVATSIANAVLDRKVRKSFDLLGRVHIVTDAENRTEVFTYDGLGNKLTYQNVSGDVWNYVYDNNGRLTEEITPQVLSYNVYDLGDGNLISTPTTARLVTKITYDAFGDVHTRREGVLRENGQPDNEFLSRLTTYVYDALGRQVSTIHPSMMVYNGTQADIDDINAADDFDETSANPTSHVTYNALGDAVVNQDVAGKYSHKAYDSLGRVVYEVDAMKFVTRYGYDAFGNVTSVKRFEIAMGTPGLIDSAAWSVADIEAPGHLAAGQDRTITKSFDRLNRETFVYQPATDVYQPGANAASGQLIHNAVGSTAYSYNAFGEMTRQSRLLDPAGGGTFADTYFFYDHRGQRVMTIDPMGYVTKNEYDVRGNVTLALEYFQKLTTNPSTWDANSAPDAPPAGSYDHDTRYEYDRLDRLVAQRMLNVEYNAFDGTNLSTNIGTQETTYGYDAVGNRTRVTNVNGGTSMSTFTYYDVLGRVNAVAEPARDGDGTTAGTQTLIPYALIRHDVYGNVVEQITYKRGVQSASVAGVVHFNDGQPNPVQSNRLQLDLHGHVIRTQDSSGANRYSSYTIRGDVAKEWQPVRNADDMLETLVTFFEYDDLGRQVAVISPQRRTDGEVLPTQAYIAQRTAYFATGPNSYWMYGPNHIVATWEPTIGVDDIFVFVQYYDTVQGSSFGSLLQDKGAFYHDGRSIAEFFWNDTDGNDRGSIDHIYRVQVFGKGANNSYNVLLRDSFGSAPPPVAAYEDLVYSQAQYNAFGEITRMGVSFSRQSDFSLLQEYYVYDNAGRLVRTNSGDGVDRVNLYDIGGRMTGEVRSQDQSLANADATSALAIAPDQRMLTETIYNKIDQIETQRLPSFFRTDGNDPAASTVSGGASVAGPLNPLAIYRLETPDPDPVSPSYYVVDPLATAAQGGGYYINAQGYYQLESNHQIVNRPRIYWAHTWDRTEEVLFEYQPSSNPNAPWLQLSVNPISAENLGVDVTGLPQGQQFNFRISYRHRSENQIYALTTGTFQLGAGNSVSVSTNGSGNPLPVPVTPYTTQVSDRWGNVLESSNTARITLRHRYNVLNLRVQTDMPEAAILDTRNGNVNTEVVTPSTFNYYDIQGRAIGSRDANDNLTIATLNDGGQTVALRAADGGTQHFKYDGFGNVTQVNDELNWRTLMEYDNANRLILVQHEITANAFTSVEYGYDQRGRRITETSGELMTGSSAEETTKYFYDLNGHIQRRVTAMGAEYFYDYDAEGRTLEQSGVGGLMTWTYDHFGRLQEHTNLNGVHFYTSYNSAGLATHQWNTNNLSTNGGAQNIYFNYDDAGNLTLIDDQAVYRRSIYAYDDAGRRIRERTDIDGLIHQNTGIAYDALGRISTLSDLRYHLDYTYDAQGNRTHTLATYFDHEQAQQSQDLWYEYDEVNRVTLSQGKREGNSLTINGPNAVRIRYDLKGQRIETRQIGLGKIQHHSYFNVYDPGNGSGPIYAPASEVRVVEGDYYERYSYDGAGRLIDTRRTGETLEEDENGNGVAVENAGDELISHRTYDNANRQIRDQRTLIETARVISEYDDDGHLKRETTRDGLTDTATIRSDVNLTLNGAGLVTSYSVTTPTYTSVFSNHFLGGETWLQTTQDVTTTSGNDPIVRGSVVRTYDQNYELKSITDTHGGAKNRYFANNAAGQTLTVVQGNYSQASMQHSAFQMALYGIGNNVKAEHFFFANGNAIGSFGQLQDENNQFKANFDANFTPISSTGPATQAGEVVTQQGDTLRGIAARVYGDGNLWYLLAEENGFTQPDTALAAGLIVRLPNRVVSIANNASTFKPFNPADAMGDVSATQVYTPEAKRCNTFAIFLIMVVVMVVTIITFGALAPAASAPASGGTDALAEAAAQAAAAPAGTAGASVAAAETAAVTTASTTTASLTAAEVGQTLFAGAVSGAAGNAAGQLTGMALDVQDQFDWKGVAQAGLSGLISAGVGMAVKIGPIGKFAESHPMLYQAASAAVGSIATQGLSVMLGLQEKFSWSSVAQAAVSAPIARYVGKEVSEIFGGSDIARDVAAGITSAGVQAALGGKFDAVQVASDIFGTLIGNSLVDRVNGAPVAQGNKPLAPEQETATPSASGAASITADAAAALPLQQQSEASAQYVGEQPAVGNAAGDSTSATESTDDMEEIVVTGIVPKLTEDDLWRIMDGIWSAPRRELMSGVRYFDRDAIRYANSSSGGQDTSSWWKILFGKPLTTAEFAEQENLRGILKNGEAVNPGDAQFMAVFQPGTSREAKLAESLRASGSYFDPATGANLLKQINSGSNVIDLTLARAQSEEYLNWQIDYNELWEESVLATDPAFLDSPGPGFRRRIDQLIESDPLLPPFELPLTEPGVMRETWRAVNLSQVLGGATDLLAAGPLLFARLAANRGGIPFGFATADEFAKFGTSLNRGLDSAGFKDVQAIMQGSAVTGRSYKTGIPFDVGRVSDFDVALTSNGLFQAAKDAGIPLRTQGTRTGPLTARDLTLLGLRNLQREVSKQAGRPVKFMIFNSAEGALRKAPSIVIPR
ncbi:MAG TPA: DUF6531 domain-containing protein [Steroidobacteraceae bacterium]|jgi:YD repeat-containing protein|nr:DUF6531 domain-containing protein [Steroidobacteraceae bacterium]